MATLPPSSATPATTHDGQQLAVGRAPAARPPPPPPPPRRPLLAPPPPVHVRLPWSSSHARTAPTSSHQAVHQPSSTAPFASLLVAPPRPLAAPLPPVPDGPMAAAAALATAAAWTVGRRARHVPCACDDEDDDDDPSTAARPCLATRAAGALDGGSGMVVGVEAEDDDDGRAPPPSPPAFDFDQADWARYRRFNKGARLGLVREWAPLTG